MPKPPAKQRKLQQSKLVLPQRVQVLSSSAPSVSVYANPPPNGVPEEDSVPGPSTPAFVHYAGGRDWEGFKRSAEGKNRHYTAECQSCFQVINGRIPHLQVNVIVISAYNLI